MKFIVYGRNGWIGSMVTDILVSAGDEVVPGRRVEDINDVLDDLKQYLPDRVICAAGRNSGPGCPTVQYLEQPGTLLENIRCNLTVPVMIGKATQLHNPAPIPVLYFGSGCIFNYDESHQVGGKGYDENDFPNFFGSAYSTVKGQTDILMRGFPHVLNARIRMPIAQDNHPKDFITKILGYEKIVSVPNSMTILPDFIPFLLGCLVEKKAGTLNAVNPGALSNGEIISLYEEVENKRHAYVSMSEAEQDDMLKSRRTNNVLVPDLACDWIRDIPDKVKQKYCIPDVLLPIQFRVKTILEHRKSINSV